MPPASASPLSATNRTSDRRPTMSVMKVAEAALNQRSTVWSLALTGCRIIALPASIAICLSLLCLVLLPNAASAQPYAYVTNHGESSVSVIDLASETVIATVPVGTGPYGVAVTPDQRHVYVG